MSEMSELDALAEEAIGRLMDAVAAGDREAVGVALAGAPMLHVVVGLAYQLHRQEVANEVVEREAQMLNSANISLFAEKRKLREQVSELRELIETKARSAPATGRVRRDAA